MDIKSDIEKDHVESQPPIDFASVLATLNGLKHHLSSVVSQIKDIERVVKKQMKQHIYGKKISHLILIVFNII